VKRKQTLRNGDMMFAWLDTVENLALKKSHGTGGATGEYRITKTDTAGFTSWLQRTRGRTCTKTSTSRPTVPFQMVGTSTTSIMTRSTTASRISRPYRQKLTLNYMGANSTCRSKRAMSAAVSLVRDEHAQGGVLRPVKSGAGGGKAQPTSAHGLNLCVKHVHVRSAAAITWPANRGQGSVLAPVNNALGAERVGNPTDVAAPFFTMTWRDYG